ncbi:beta-lactamase [Metarhizium album ARSEF 1941]|uniref:Beta-lactamase n=1 Tax=Metarhizium album (strain ARSEF 1941) TaxID=1081103 RepID=A0A0B2WPT0_METAS|nr:beta-lactamase [Metarhizium album ARSEF 1941]KHN94995.1 beta-lactamase [Metarhizium album ARSEF 1941]
MAAINGECDAKFANVRQLLQQQLASGDELGASICVSINGKTVVDIWGGHVDADRTRPWAKDTLCAVWSTTKCVTNLAALMLVDRGLLDPDEKVARYWPEFAANGKENVEVRHFLGHTSGLAAWESPVTIEDIYDVPSATARLARQSPWWTPGTASGYHLVSQGHLVAELVRRVSGKSVKEFVQGEIAEPLGADFHIGAEEKDWERICDLIPPPASSTPPGKVDVDGVRIKAFKGTPIKAEHAGTPEFRKAELAGMGGFGNARSIAAILSVISLGGSVGGKRLLSENTIDLIFKEQASGNDLVLLVPLTWGMGFALANGSVPNGWFPKGRICYWVGWGGSAGIMDLDRKMTIGYAPNKMGEGGIGTARTEAYVRAIYSALSEPESSD